MPTPDPFSRRRFVLAGLVAAALGACRSSGSSGERTAGSSTTLAVGSGNAPSSAAPPTAPSTPAPGTLPPTSSPASVGPARYVAHGDRTLANVALTFHASGDPALAQQLLDVVARAAVPITVFGVGQWMAQHPDLVGRIAHDGHELANHTLTHQAMGRLPEDRSTPRSRVAPRSFAP